MQYYVLAAEVLPNSGFGQHQQAVLALHANKYFYALSHLYHSLCSEIPYPEASQNLEILLRKRLNIPWDDLIQKVWTQDGGSPVATLRAWFLKFHLECYQGAEFSRHDQMESEIVTQLSNALKDNTDLSSTLMHMVTISTGGEFFALEKANREVEPEKNAKACFFLIHHNVKLFRELLYHLYDKLEGQFRESVTSSSQDFMPKLPPVTETTIQCIRLYTLWLVKTWKLLQQLVESGSPDHAIVAVDIRQLWHIFADCLNAIFQQYPLLDSKSVEDVEYLLEEERSTVGFRPFHDDKNANVWTMKDGKPKAIFREQKSDALQEQEHLIRLRDIMTRGFIIAQEPVSLLFLFQYVISTNFRRLHPSSWWTTKSKSTRLAQLPICSRRRQHGSTRVSQVSQSPRLLLLGVISSWPLLKVTSLILASGLMELTSRHGMCRRLPLRLLQFHSMAMVNNRMAVVSYRMATVNGRMDLVSVLCSRPNRRHLQTVAENLSQPLPLSSWFRRHTTLK